MAADDEDNEVDGNGATRMARRAIMVMTTFMAMGDDDSRHFLILGVTVPLLLFDIGSLINLIPCLLF